MAATEDADQKAEIQDTKTVARSYPLDPGQQWRQNGAKQIEGIHRDEICPSKPYPRGTGQGRQNKNRHWQG